MQPGERLVYEVHLNHFRDSNTSPIMMDDLTELALSQKYTVMALDKAIQHTITSTVR